VAWTVRRSAGVVVAAAAALLVAALVLPAGRDVPPPELLWSADVGQRWRGDPGDDSDLRLVPDVIERIEESEWIDATECVAYVAQVAVAWEPAWIDRIAESLHLRRSVPAVWGYDSDGESRLIAGTRWFRMRRRPNGDFPPK